MITVQVELKGDKEAMAQLERLKDTLNGFRYEMQKVGDYMREFFTNDVFSSSGGVFQEPWAPLSAAYAEYKAKRWGSTQILVASGRMRASYRLYTATDYVILRNEATNDQGAYYARYHQDGTQYMPARIMMKFDRTRLDKIKDIIVDSINNRIRNAL